MRPLGGFLGLILALPAAAQAPAWQVEVGLGVARLERQNGDAAWDVSYRPDLELGLARALGTHGRFGCGVAVLPRVRGSSRRSGNLLLLRVADYTWTPGRVWSFRLRGGFARYSREHPSFGFTAGCALERALGPDSGLSLACDWVKADQSTSVPADPGKDPKDSFHAVALVWCRRF